MLIIHSPVHIYENKYQLKIERAGNPEIESSMKYSTIKINSLETMKQFIATEQYKIHNKTKLEQIKKHEN